MLYFIDLICYPGAKIEMIMSSQEDKPRKKHVEIMPTFVHFYNLKDTFLPLSLAFSHIWKAILQAEYKSPSKKHRPVLREFFVVKYLQSVSQGSIH